LECIAIANRPSLYSLIPTGLATTDRILISVGKLVSVWANCESCFYAAYFCLSGRPNGNADIAWASIQSTRRRMELIYNLVRYDPDLSDLTKSEIFKCLDDFKSVTELRNFLCHSRYHTEDEANEIIVSINSWGLAPISGTTAPIFKEKSKPATNATINEICDAADRCLDIDERITRCVYKIRDELKLQHVELPPPPPLRQ
jgi:hypothetical protein